MDHSQQKQDSRPPIGIAGVACLACLAVVCLATRPFIGFLDHWGIQWLLYASLPVVTAFVILYRSSWHPELPRVTRILSMILSACIIYGVVLLAGALTIAIASIFFSSNMVSS